MSLVKIGFLYSIVCFSLILFYCRAVLNPLQHRLHAAQQQFNTLQFEYQQRLRTQHEADHAQQQTNQLAKQFPVLLRQLSAPLTTADISQELMRLAQRFQLQLQRLSPALPEIASPKELLQKSRITLQLQGHYDSLTKFIAALQLASGIYAIRQLEIRSIDSESVTATLQLECAHHASK